MTVIYINSFAYRMRSYSRVLSLQTNLYMIFHSTWTGCTFSSKGKSLQNSSAAHTSRASELKRVILQYRFCYLNSPNQKLYSSSKGISNTYCCKDIKIIFIHKTIQQTPTYISKQLEENSRNSFNFHM